MRDPSFACRFKRRWLQRAIAVLPLLCSIVCWGQSARPEFKVLAIAEQGGVHRPFVDAAMAWLAHEAKDGGFTVDYIDNTQRIDDAFLAQYRLFIQLNYPPYAWTRTAARRSTT